MSKLLRSLQLLAPRLSDARYDAQVRLSELLCRPWRTDVLGLRDFDYQSPLVVDIGANRGLSIAATRMLLPQARIIGFEPQPRLAERLRRHHEGNERVRIEQVALGETPGELPFHVPVYRGYPLDALSSLRREEAAGWLTAERIYWFDARKLSVDTFAVPVRPLDDYALAPSFVKMYVQGAEPAVIEGAARTLTRHSPAVLAPAEAPAVDAAMRKLGYARFAHRSQGAEGNRFVRDGEGSYFSWYLAGPTLARLKVPVVEAAASNGANGAPRAQSPSASG